MTTPLGRNGCPAVARLIKGVYIKNTASCEIARTDNHRFASNVDEYIEYEMMDFAVAYPGTQPMRFASSLKISGVTFVVNWRLTWNLQTKRKGT